MSDFKNLTVSIEDAVLTITIDREKKLNALNLKTLEELEEAIQIAYDENEVRGVIINGAGEKAFAAGADISEFSEINELNARKFSERGQEIFDLIEKCVKPVIGVVSGYALGGGCELAMACHMRIATASAQFGQPEVNLGLVPGYGGTQRLTHLIGRGRATEFLLTGEMITAENAHQWGLANHVAGNKEEAMTKAKGLLRKIREKAPAATESVIECVNAAFSEENGYQTEANTFARCCATNDFKEGVAAFIEKRTPHFEGN